MEHCGNIVGSEREWVVETEVFPPSNFKFCVLAVEHFSVVLILAFRFIVTVSPYRRPPFRHLAIAIFNNTMRVACSSWRRATVNHIVLSRLALAQTCHASYRKGLMLHRSLGKVPIINKPWGYS